MFATTQAVCGMAFGAGRGDGALLAVPAIPAVAVFEAGAAAVGAVRSVWGKARRGVAVVLRGWAHGLDPAPEGSEAAGYVRGYHEGFADGWDGAKGSQALARVEEDAPVVAPVLVMASAAQVTLPLATEAESVAVVGPEEEAPCDGNCVECLDEALRTCGTVRAAARSLGIAESTFRTRAKRLGVKLPGRKAKG